MKILVTVPLWLRLALVSLLAAIAIILPSSFVTPVNAAPINCGALPHWSKTNPQINQTHIFCGELKNGKVKGFHSRPGGQTPATVGRLVISQSANGQGIYGGTWNYRGTTIAKSSTFFPDTCSQAQVLQSVLYAMNHEIGCPSGAPNWAYCGLSQPTGNAAGYCKAKNNVPFTIAFGLLNNGAVNTAFPLRQ